MLLVALAAQAQDDAAQPGDDQPAAAPEFLDFLEYLGSWDGDEQDWVQFIDVDEKVPAQDPGTPKREVEQVELEDVDDVVS